MTTLLHSRSSAYLSSFRLWYRCRGAPVGPTPQMLLFWVQVSVLHPPGATDLWGSSFRFYLLLNFHLLPDYLNSFTYQCLIKCVIILQRFVHLLIHLLIHYVSCILLVFKFVIFFLYERLVLSSIIMLQSTSWRGKKLIAWLIDTRQHLF